LQPSSLRHFLGILRAVLSRETSALVTAFVNKDLGHVKTDEMSKHLQDEPLKLFLRKE
jgi:hypothetical protein